MQNRPQKRQKKSQQSRDIHPADVKAELAKLGYTLTSLAKENGYKSTTSIKRALTQNSPKAEKIIAKKLGTTPKRLWPSRFEPQPKVCRCCGAIHYVNSRNEF